MIVTKEEYLEFIQNYKNPLETFQTEVVDPPMLCHSDKVTGKVVANIEMDYMDDSGNEDHSLYRYFISDDSYIEYN